MSDPPRPLEHGAQSSDESRAAAARLYAQGRVLAKQGLWSEAEATFFQSAGLAPDASLTWLSAAIACFQQGRFTQAATAIEWALHAIPIRATTESEKGVKSFEADDWGGVESAFQALLEKGPPEAPTHLFLSIALIRLERYDEAWDQLRAGYELELRGAESVID
jgi:Flp pilus assembly protein TadD